MNSVASIVEAVSHMQYHYRDAEPTWANAYLWPVLKSEVSKRSWSEKRAFDLGCGNGATCQMLHEIGFQVTGIDVSREGIEQAQRAYPQVRVEIASCYDDLVARFGTFPLVISLEVIEYCTDPRAFAKSFLSLIAPNGLGFLSTPYHGYLKNLSLSLANKWDSHHDALCNRGPIKFFSIPTLRALLEEAGAQRIDFRRVGRIGPLARSMVALVT